MIPIGQPVPDISFQVYHNDEIEKKALGLPRKMAYSFFYPADFTFICPTELEEMAKLYPEFAKINTEIVSVSTDTVFVHKAWHDNSPAIKNYLPHGSGSHQRIGTRI